MKSFKSVEELDYNELQKYINKYKKTLEEISSDVNFLSKEIEKISNPAFKKVSQDNLKSVIILQEDFISNYRKLYTYYRAKSDEYYSFKIPS